jgi:WD40 repeat protein
VDRGIIRKEIETFARAVLQSAFVLIENPKLTFSQLYNRLQWWGDKDPLLVSKLAMAKILHQKPWLHLVNTPFHVENLFAVLSGHSGSVTSCAFNPDNKYILTADEDSRIRLWDASIGIEIYVLEDHSCKVTLCSFNKKGNRFITACEDMTLRIWDTLSGAPILKLNGHTAEISSCSFSPDDRRIVSISQDGTLLIWDAETGAAIKNFKAPEGATEILDFHWETELAAVVKDGEEIQLWNADLNNRVAAFHDFSSKVYSCVFIAEGNRLLSIHEREIIVWSISKKDKHVTIKHPNRNVWDISPDESRLAAVDYRFEILNIWQLMDGQSFGIRSHTDQIYVCAFSPDGDKIITGSRDKTVKMWESNSGKWITSYRGHDGEISKALFSPDGNRILTTCLNGPPRIWIADVDKSSVVHNGHDYAVMSCLYSPDGGYALSASGDAVLLWDARSGKIINRIFAGHYEQLEPQPLAFNADSNSWVGYNSDKLTRHDTKSGETVGIFEGSSGRITCCSFAPDGKYMVTGDSEGHLVLWNSDDFKEVRRFGQYSKLENGESVDQEMPSIKSEKDIFGEIRQRELIAIKNIQFGPDGKRMLSQSKDLSLHLWEVETGSPIAKLNHQMNDVIDYHFSPDGRMIATAGEDGCLTTWDSETGKKLMSMSRYEGPVKCCSFAQDGKRLFSVGSDGTIRVWDPFDGRMLKLIETGDQECLRCIYTPYGNQLISQTKKDELSIWDSEKGSKITTFKGHSSIILCFDVHPSESRILIGDYGGQVFHLNLLPVFFIQ